MHVYFGKSQEDYDAVKQRIAVHQKAYRGPVLKREPARAGPLGAPMHLDKQVWSAQTYWKPKFGSECAADKAVMGAAIAGYNVPEEEGGDTQAENAAEEGAVLLGDVHKLSENQKRTLLLLKEASQHASFKLKQISLSFSGASVFFFSPSRKDGTPMPSSVLKFDVAENVKEEIELTERYGKLFGLTTPKVKDSQFLDDVPDNEPCAVMQIDLCGGVFGLPEFASAPPVLTFASVIQEELRSNRRQVDVVPIVNEALARRMYAFTMSTRSVRKENLAKMYKIVRFVGHGVLNRAVEGAKRGKKNPALAAGFLNPPDIDDLDPEGNFIRGLCGKRATIKRFFQEFSAHEERFNKKFERHVVCGLAHNDLHGGNLLLDSQGLVWLIDFATVKDNVHVLMDLSKFMASCLFLYLEDNVAESHIQSFAKLLFTVPDATTALPPVGGEDLKQDLTATFVLELLMRIRHCLCVYEVGDDAPNNDGVPFSLAFFSWSARMLSYSEPNLHQKTRAAFFALVGAHRTMWEAGVDVGPTALEWIEQYRSVWEGEKGRKLSTSATPLQMVSYEFQVEFPRYLAQIGTSEAWSTDFLTREKVHVTDHCISVDVKYSGRLFPRYLQLPRSVLSVQEKLRRVHEKYLPDLLSQDKYQGRLFVIGDSGTGKTLLTKQLFSEVAQQQLLSIRGEVGDLAGTSSISGMSLIPLRLPLIDLGRQLEADPDLSVAANPGSDLLTEWMQRKYGRDSIPHKLVIDVRNLCLLGASAPPEVQHQEGTSGRTSTLSSGEPRGGHPEQEHIRDDVKALFLLFDGLDEASSSRLQVLEFIRSLLQSELSHPCVLTSRPGNLGPPEYDLLAQLGFVSFKMGALSLPQAQEVVERTLTRMREAQETISAIAQRVGDPGYSSLRENPLILTLLIHVLRKFQTQLSEGRGQEVAGLSDQHRRMEVMRKTDVYQRAVKLILHQSDAAKFALRDGASDQAMVRRLEMLKSVRARQLFQSVSYQAHRLRQRSTTWEAMKGASDDIGMIVVMKEAFQDGRMPIFEKVDSCGSSEPEVQLTHLSFQELMSGEYCSAIVGHAHSQKKMRAYVNILLSNSAKCLDRERLSESWWLQVWFHIFEMLEPEALEEYCKILAEDERTQLMVGSMSMAHPHGLSIPYNVLNKAINGIEFKHRLSEPTSDVGLFMVAAINWDEYEADMVFANTGCLKRTFQKEQLAGYAMLPWWCDSVHWRLDGVAMVLRYACSLPSLDVLDRLLSNGVHPGMHFEDGHDAFIHASTAKKWDACRVLRNHRNDYNFMNWGNFGTWWHWPCGREEKAFLPAWDWNSALDQLHGFKPYGTLQQASDGTLLIAPGVDVNFADPATGLTPLMLAASHGNLELVRTLLVHQAEVNAKTAEGCTALTMAADMENGPHGLECMKLLIGAGADLSVKTGKGLNRPVWALQGARNSVLTGPAQSGDSEKLELLLDARADANSENDFGFTPLFYAMRSNSATCIKLLVKHGACLSTEFNKVKELRFKGLPHIYNSLHPYGMQKQTCLYTWVLYAPYSVECLRSQFDSGVDPNTCVDIDFGWLRDMPVACYLHADYWFVGCDDKSKADLFLERGLDVLKPYGKLNTTVIHFLAMLSVNAGLGMHFLKSTPDPEKAMAMKCKFFGDLPTLSKKLGNQAFVDAIDDFKKMRADEKERSTSESAPLLLGAAQGKATQKV